MSIKRIAVLTRDCAGINAAIRAVVRSATARGVEVLGVVRGYEGLIDGDLRPLDRRAVSGIINLGGTILKTARSEKFMTAPGQEQAVEVIRRNRIDGLIVIGGNGSLAGAGALDAKHGITVVGIPATIDNDINGVDPAIGVDTAANVALDALDKIRDTATSLERIFVVEVMGRKSGWLAMRVALAGGTEDVLVPELEMDMESIYREIRAGFAQGKISWIIVTAEGKASAADVAAAIGSATGLETRIAVLGHIQRGGRPTAADRILAARLGVAAVERLAEGRTGILVHMANGAIGTLPLAEAIRPKSIDLSADYRLLKLLS